MASQKLYQRFRSKGTIVRIAVHEYPQGPGRLVVIWSDIQACFPGVVRIQDGDIYVPFERDEHLYRIKPHGIKYQPDTILDIIYRDNPTSPKEKRSTRKSNTNAILQAQEGEHADTPPPLPQQPAPIIAAPSVASSLVGSLPASQLSTQQPDLDSKAQGSTQIQYLSKNTKTHLIKRVTKRKEAEHPALRFRSLQDLANYKATMEALPDIPKQNAKLIPEASTKDKLEATVTTGTKGATGANGKGNVSDISTTPPTPDTKTTIVSSNPTEALDATLEFTTNSKREAKDTYKTKEQALETSSKKIALQPSITHVPSFDEILGKSGDDVSDSSSPSSTPTGEILDSTIMSIVPISTQHNAPTAEYSIKDIMLHRIQAIMARRYTWLESPCPKLFTILPVKDFEVTKLPTLSMFRVHFLCDCGDIVKIDGEQDISPPHLPAREEPYAIKSDSIISTYGAHMMAVLEMMFYMKIVPLDKRMVERIRYAVTFLLTKKVPSSIRFHDRKIKSLQDVPVIEPLDNSGLKDLYTQYLVDAEQPLGGFRAFQTDKGDIRWICILHLSKYAPNTVFERPTRFLAHPSSLSGAYWASLGVFRVIVKDRQRATDLYSLIQSLVSVPVMSFYLDWEMTQADILELAKAVSDFPTSCVMINVREDPINYKDPLGLGHPYNEVVRSALSNSRIQAFSLEKRKLEVSDEFSSFERSFYLDSVIVKFKRDLKIPGKTIFAGLVTDMDGALSTLNTSLCGLNRFSELTLEVGFWDQVTIKFVRDLGEFNPESGEDWYTYSSEYMEAIELRACIRPDTMLLNAKCLTDVMISFKFPTDGPKIRNVIKNNNRLKKLELSVSKTDDACQIFEYFKALLANHPSLDSFHISQEHFHAKTSIYTWESVADRSKMTLGIECGADDRIGTMLQKFASCLTTLMIYGLGPQEALILEKVLRPKRGPFKLRSIFLLNVCALSLEAMDSLKKIVLRDTAPEFSISGSVDGSTEIGPLADFLIAVAPKVTRLHLYGKNVRDIYMELERRMPESSVLDRLTELLISGPLEISSVENEMKWLRSILKKPVPLTTLEIKSADLGHDGWMTLVKEIDFTNLSDLIISPTTPVKIAVLEAIVAAVPDASSLGAVVVTCEDMPQARREEFRDILLKKMRGGAGGSNKGLVMINGFIK
ncbi:hypothetical protein BGZ94_008938 [Podila epigama]|nr:hypothetical protein BGZ94_008938 [Podila epigama]